MDKAPPPPHTEHTFTSVFSNVSSNSNAATSPTATVSSFLNVRNIAAFFIFGAVIACCIFGYIYRDWVFEKTGYYTLQLYLGKPNEIHRTEIPRKSRLRTIYEDFEILEQLRL